MEVPQERQKTGGHICGVKAWLRLSRIVKREANREYGFEQEEKVEGEGKWRTLLERKRDKAEGVRGRVFRRAGT